jgi:succinate dehydrogenase hydrophobic anchor subunit
MRRADASSLLWLAQAISGFALPVLLGLHMVANHFVVEGGLRTYSDVLAYLSHPAVFALELLFLLIVVPHAFLGLRAVLLDLGPKPRTMRFLDVGLIILGTATLLYGITLFVTLRSQL